MTEHESAKIVTMERLGEIRRRADRERLRIVSTNGCFDLVHAAHVRMLRRARSLGDVLVVGVNSDASVRRVKGPTRPIVPEGDRAAVLAGLEAVDYVVIFDDVLPSAFLERLRPDVHCKSGDYTPEAMPETAVVEAGGGRVEILPLEPGMGTSELIGRILRAEDAEGGDPAETGGGALELLLDRANELRQVAYRLAGLLDGAAAEFAERGAADLLSPAREAVRRFGVEPPLQDVLAEALLRLARRKSEPGEPDAQA